MAGRKRKSVTLKDIDRWIRQGYGVGERESYRPWLRVQDVPSRGVSEMVHGLTIDRDHHLLSSLESRLFLLFDFARNVVDIREQYPLFPLAETLNLAEKRLQIRHPLYPGTQTPVVLTIDFLLTLREPDGRKRLLPIEAKYKSEFTTTSRKLKRLLEKLELKRQYWEARGLKLVIATEDLVPDNLYFNLRALHQVAVPEAHLHATENRTAFLEALAETHWQNVSLERLLANVAEKTSCTQQEALKLFKYFAWHHWIEIDLHTKLNPRTPLPHMRVAVDEGTRKNLYAKVVA